MKKFKSVLLTMAMMLSLISVIHTETVSVQAYVDYDLYPLACDAFQVARLNNSGGFDQVACTSNWTEAKNLMYAQGDAGVIRHKASVSATKIVDMSAGVVYSYPQRNGRNTATIKQYVQDTANEKTTYVTIHREMQYRGLYTYDGNGDGLVNVMLQGFEGFIHLNDVDLIPMKAVTDGIPIYIAGNDTAKYKEEPVKSIVRQSYYEVKQNGNYRDLVFHWYSDWPKDSSMECISWTHVIGPAPDWMNENTKYYSYDCSTFYSDVYCSNQVGVYYPYYEFLPLRTESKISGEVLDAYLNSLNKTDSVMAGKGADFVEAGKKYGINALLMYAIGCLESGYGTSTFAKERNNLFGISAYDSNPNDATWFSSVKDCVEQEAGYFLRGFMQTNDFRFFGSHLGNKGSGVNVKYAGDPYWGMKIAAIAYEIDKFANEYNGNLTDGNSVALGVVKNDERVNLLTSPNGKVSYNTAYGTTYQKNYTMAVLEEQDGWYKVQSTNYLSNGVIQELWNSDDLRNYDWNYTVYIPKDKVLLTNNVTVNKLGSTPTGEEVQTLESAELNDGILTVRGKSYMPGIYVTESNTASGSITIYDLYYNEIKRVDATLEKSGFDELTYTCALDLKDLKPGSYLLKYNGVYSQYSEYNTEFYLPVYSGTVQETYRNQTITLGGESILSLQVKERDCGTGATYDEKTQGCICLSGYENFEENKGCALKPADQEKLVLRRGVSYVEYPDDHTVVLNGLAYFEGMNASVDSDIEASILIVNMEDKSETVLPATMSSMDIALDIGDGYDYRKILWTGSIDLASLENGNYYLKLRLRNGEQVNDTVLVCIDDSAKLHSFTIDGNSVRFFGSEESNFRLEIAKDKNSIDYSLIQKPTQRPSIYAENSDISLVDGILKMDGFAYPINTSVMEANHPVYTLILMDQNGVKQAEIPATMKACTFDITELTGSKYKVSNSCFTVEYDMKDLPVGSYSLFLDMKTDEVRDIIAVGNLYPYGTEDVTVGKRTYALNRSKVHDRYELLITDEQ